VTSVLFGDIVGFTPLSESRDAEEVRELLSRYFAECRTVIARYGGVVEKFIGDAVMAVWGVPVAREDDAERAVRAGLELVAAIDALGEDVGAPGLAMRVGIVTGEVAVTVGATDEGMVAGDSVNTAARVQSTAPPGQVWVDGTTRSLAGGVVGFEDTGSHDLKGKAEPLQLWRATGVVGSTRGGQRVDGLQAPLVGRDRELRLLKELFHACEESDRPRLVVVDGEAGMGKSRLGWEFETYCSGLAATIRWHRGRCLSYGDGVAFWALGEAIRGRLGLSEGETGDVVVDRLETGLVTYVADEDERDWLRPRLAILIGADTQAGPAREDLFAAWTAFLEHVADGNPLVLVVEDAEHADNGLLDFLDHLSSTARAPVLVLVLARPDLLRRRPELGGRRAAAIRLEPLMDPAMGQLIDGLVTGLPPSARTALIGRAEGVPLFAVETVRALIDIDAVIPRDGRYVATDRLDAALQSLGAPASLHALIAARLDALTPAERHVVADASVLGQAFTREGLTALTPEGVDFDATLTSLRRKDVISIETDRFSGERGQYRFVQGVVRQVAYSSQSKRDRRTRHLAAVDYLSSQSNDLEDLAVVVAQHLLDAVDSSSSGDPELEGLSQRACDLLERAAYRAKGLGAPTEALGLAKTALDRSRDPIDRSRLHLLASEAASWAGRHTESLQHARLAMDGYDAEGLAGDAGRAAAQTAAALTYLGDLDGALTLAMHRWQGLEAVEGAEVAQLRLAEAVASAHWDRSDMDGVLTFGERYATLAETVGGPEERARALVGLANRSSVLGMTTEAHALYEGAVEIGREHGIPHVFGVALMNRALLYLVREPTTAVSYLREADDVVRRSGFARFADYATVNLLLALWMTGRLAEAASVLEERLDDVSTRELGPALAALGVWLAEARGTDLPAEPDPEETFDGPAARDRACLEVSHALARGDTRHAASRAAQSVQQLFALGLSDDFVVEWPPFVLAALADHDLDGAERLLAPVATAVPGALSPAVAAQLHRLTGLLKAAKGDPPAEVEAELRAGIEALTSIGARGYAAQTEEDLGHWLLTQGRKDDAAPLLTHARAVYKEIGALGWLTRLDSALDRDGAPSIVTVT